MKSGFHLAIVQPRWRPDGGVERFVSRAVESLAQHDVRVTIICREWQPHEAGMPAPNIVRCNPMYFGRTWDERSFARAVCDVLREIRPDCVHSHVRTECCDVYRAGGGVHAEWLTQRSRSLADNPLRRLSIKLSPYHEYVLRTERRLYSNPGISAFICNSAMVRNEIVQRFGTPAEKIRVIYNAVDRGVFKPDESGEARRQLRSNLGLRGEEVLLLFAGSGFARKGMQSLLEAVAQVDRRASLLVLGRDKHLGSFQRLAHRLNVADRVHWKGVVSDTLPYLQGADAFVLPTLYDPFSNAVLEAFAVGLPVLTSQKCGAVDFIRDGETGFICDALDVEGIASRTTLLLDVQTRERIGAAGREATKHLTPDAMSSELVSLYKEVAALRS